MLHVVGCSRATSQSSWIAEISCIYLAKLQSKTFSVSLSIAYPISFLLVEKKEGGKQHKLFIRTTEEEEIEGSIYCQLALARVLLNPMVHRDSPWDRTFNVTLGLEPLPIGSTSCKKKSDCLSFPIWFRWIYKINPGFGNIPAGVPVFGKYILSKRCKSEVLLYETVDPH